jgi:hypothetical protein
MTDEEYLASRWEWFEVSYYNQDGDATKPVCFMALPNDDHVQYGYDTREKVVAAAAEFTRLHEEEIRQLREEIHLMEYHLRKYKNLTYEELLNPTHEPTRATYERILIRLQSLLADKLRGWKE